jgi:hypothetical protein
MTQEDRSKVLHLLDTWRNVGLFNHLLPALRRELDGIDVASARSRKVGGRWCLPHHPHPLTPSPRSCPMSCCSLALLSWCVRPCPCPPWHPSGADAQRYREDEYPGLAADPYPPPAPVPYRREHAPDPVYASRVPPNTPSYDAPLEHPYHHRGHPSGHPPLHPHSHAGSAPHTAPGYPSAHPVPHAPHPYTHAPPHGYGGGVAMGEPLPAPVAAPASSDSVWAYSSRVAPPAAPAGPPPVDSVWAHSRAAAGPALLPLPDPAAAPAPVPVPVVHVYPQQQRYPDPRVPVVAHTPSALALAPGGSGVAPVPPAPSPAQARSTLVQDAITTLYPTTYVCPSTALRYTKVEEVRCPPARLQ